MEKATSNAQQGTIRAGCSADPNTVGETLSANGDSNEGGDIKELVALVGQGSSGLGSSSEAANGLAQANSVAANKVQSAPGVARKNEDNI